MRDAVDATGREIEQLSDEDAARLGYVSLLKERDPRGVCLVCAAAARNGDLEALKALLEDGYSMDWRTCEATAEGGHVEVQQWLHENDLWWEEDCGCAYAAEGGHLEALRCMRENDFCWSEGTCANAAKNGHLETLKWAHENGCPWDEETCDYAAKNGHLETLKWARENGCPWDGETCSEAATGGELV
jgi:hypothetical protein